VVYIYRILMFILGCSNMMSSSLMCKWGAIRVSRFLVMADSRRGASNLPGNNYSHYGNGRGSGSSSQRQHDNDRTDYYAPGRSAYRSDEYERTGAFQHSTIQPRNRYFQNDSPDAEIVPNRANVNPKPFTIFSCSSMMMFIPYPAIFELISGKYVSEKEGFVNMVILKREESSKSFDKENKIKLSISANHIGTILSLADGASETLDFPHGFSMVVSIQDKGTLFSLVDKNNESRNIDIPVARASFSSLKSMLQWTLPYLYGWHGYADPESIRPKKKGRT